MAATSAPIVYARHACVCVFDSVPRMAPRQEADDKTARGRYECSHTHSASQSNPALLLLLLLLERIRIVVVVGHLLRVRIRFVYGVLVGGVR